MRWLFNGILTISSKPGQMKPETLTSKRNLSKTLRLSHEGLRKLLVASHSAESTSGNELKQKPRDHPHSTSRGCCDIPAARFSALQVCCQLPGNKRNETFSNQSVAKVGETIIAHWCCATSCMKHRKHV
jgi:hypothetical protein